MPIVSINLSPKAYAIYDYLAKTRKASSIVSQCLINWDTSQVPALQLGDRRLDAMNRPIEWTEDGWKEVTEVVETENQRWMREQKEAYE